MLDRWTTELVRPILLKVARSLSDRGVSPDQLTLCGFLLGLGAPISISFGLYGLGLIFIVLNRFIDGLDGTVARLTRTSDAGAYLDIVLDFMFYGLVVLSFGLANPEQNGLAAATLLASFIGTGSSFLAFGILAERRQMKAISYPSKGFYYLGGLAEGTETIAAFFLFCLFPENFPTLAYGFAVLCLVTLVTRIIGGYHSLRS